MQKLSSILLPLRNFSSFGDYSGLVPFQFGEYFLNGD
jgi:hypothetical protein